MAKAVRVLFGAVIAAVLTALTQIGGVVFLFCLALFPIVDKKVNGKAKRLIVKISSFVLLYLLTTIVFVPITAKSFGRVPLPMFGNHGLHPANIWTCLLNRQYVRPQLREAAYKVATSIQERYPGANVNFLDANFPFIDGFPLLPHLSHNDGKKLDLSFQYNERQTNQIVNDVPSFIGYGICEEPAAGEVNTPADCKQRGYWQYSLLREIVSQSDRNEFLFDAGRTAELANGFAAHAEIGKIFIEPHLKTRLGLTSNKFRFHGCQAVRHDDHIHVQLR